jgi:hypothetical protein
VASTKPLIPDELVLSHSASSTGLIASLGQSAVASGLRLRPLADVPLAREVTAEAFRVVAFERVADRTRPFATAMERGYQAEASQRAACNLT